ncbi:MAG: T9SS type A sorting domain-containing protein [Chitinophagales bacterium]|nr:T9SS type A sorting domain-containing protein [Chitinophagales bacterium]
MKLYLFILSLLSPLCLLAQNTSITFNKTFTNDSISILAQVVRPTSDGYLVWGGYTSTNITNARYLMKFDQVGNFVWSRNIVAGSQWNVIEDGKFVTETTDHKFVLALGGIVNNAAKEIHLIKMDDEGTELWHRSYANDSIKVIKQIIQTTDGGFALAGAIGSINADTARCLLIKTDTAGYIQWQKTYSMGNDARAFSVQQTPWDGGYILGAWGYSPTTGYDMFVVKTNSIGDSLWSRRYGNIYNDCGCLLTLGTTLQEYQAGVPITYFITSCQYNSNNFWESKLYIAKLNNTGDIIWQRQHDDYDEFSSLLTYPIVRQGKRVIGVASFNNINGVYNPVIVSFNADGTIAWKKEVTLDPTKSSYIKDMRPTEDGGYVLAGYQYSSPQTAWVLKIDSLGNTCSFVGCDSTIYTGYPIGLTQIANNNNWSVTPNPSSEQVFITPYFTEKSATFVLYDLLGRAVRQVGLDSGTAQISVLGLPAGTYFYQIINPQKQILQHDKLIVLH